SLIGVLLASLYNPNLAWDEYSRLCALAEVEASAITARLLGFDPGQAGGVFTFGGTATTLYAVRIGLEKACPGSFAGGLRGEDAVLFASAAAHYCKYSVAAWAGMGSDRALVVPVDDNNAIDLAALAAAARAALKAGRKIAAFIATMGTTDSFGL